MAKITMRNNPTCGQIWNVATTEQLLHDAAESMMRKVYDLHGYSVPFDENPLKEQLIANMYDHLLTGAKKAVDCNGLANASYYDWKHL